MQTIDVEATGLREMNATLQAQNGSTNQTAWEVINAKGSHALAVGLDAPIDVTVKGSTGYYCGGMNKQATIRIHGSAGPGVAENMMSGSVIIEGEPTFDDPAPIELGDVELWAGSDGVTCLPGTSPGAARL